MRDGLEETFDLDLLILGSGVAGLSAAVRAAARPDLRVGVLTKAALDQATTEGRVKPGSLLLLVAFGAGFTWGSTVIRW